MFLLLLAIQHLYYGFASGASCEFIKTTTLDAENGIRYVYTTNYRSTSDLVLSCLSTITLFEGHFLQMGGLIFCCKGDYKFLPPDAILDDKRSDRLYTAAREELQNLLTSKLTREDIVDRSKGDALTKGLVIIQTLWFTAQCIARLVQRLALTELEVVTLAYAVLNGVTYFFWWDKPLDVQSPVILHLDVECPPERVYATNSQSKPPSRELGFKEIVREWWHKILKAAGHTLLLPVYVGFPISFNTLSAACVYAAADYEPSTGLRELSNVRGAHVVLVRPLNRYSENVLISGTYEFVTFLLAFSVLLYTPARVILVVVGCWSLSSIPATGHQSIEWGEFIPHL
ncbi:hypothetical protein MD484_g6457, partial [Candolleomyces efflorescens]